MLLPSQATPSSHEHAQRWSTLRLCGFTMVALGCGIELFRLPSSMSASTHSGMRRLSGAAAKLAVDAAKRSSIQSVPGKGATKAAVEATNQQRITCTSQEAANSAMEFTNNSEWNLVAGYPTPFRVIRSQHAVMSMYCMRAQLWRAAAQRTHGWKLCVTSRQTRIPADHSSS
jgi:hypothetical protein